jgi:hypothetical protein
VSRAEGQTVIIEDAGGYRLVADEPYQVAVDCAIKKAVMRAETVMTDTAVVDRDGDAMAAEKKS